MFFCDREKLLLIGSFLLFLFCKSEFERKYILVKMLIIEDIEVLSELTEVETFSSRNFDDLETQSNKTYVTSEEFRFDDNCKEDLLILLRIPQRMPLNQILPQLETFCESYASDSSSNEPLSSPDSRRELLNRRKISPIKEVSEYSRSSTEEASDSHRKSFKKLNSRPPTRRSCWQEEKKVYDKSPRRSKSFQKYPLCENNQVFEFKEIDNFKNANPFVLLDNYGILITSKGRNQNFKVSSDQLLVIQVDTDRDKISERSHRSLMDWLKVLVCCSANNKKTLKARVCKTYFVKCKRKEEDICNSRRVKRCSSSHI